MSKVNIEGLTKAEVLLALYNASHIQGMGSLQAVPDFTLEMAEAELKNNYYIDYCYGRVIKVDFSDDTEIETSLFDRDCGEGAGEAAIAKLRALNSQKWGIFWWV